MGQKLGFFSPPVESLGQETLVQGLKDGKYKKIVIMCGAGISTSAGVPDFRSPSMGLYSKLRRIEGLPYPEAVFDGGFFARNPKPFYTLVREIYPQRLCPTDTHKFFKLLDMKGFLLRVYTQNIDALEFLAGLPAEKVVEAHGTFQRSYCTDCRKDYDLEWLKHSIFHPELNDGVPKCTDCHKGVVRPDIVFFGESLPQTFWSYSSSDFSECDLLLVFGTSLAVSPFNTLVGKPNSRVPRVYINRTRPGSAGGILPWLMGLGANVSFNRPTDMVLQSDCDETVRKLCQELGWTRDLDDIEVKILEA